MLLGAGVNSGIYKFFLLLHILTVIVGFGGLLLSGLYAREAGKQRGAARAVSEANLAVSKIAMYFIYAVPVLGFGLVGLSKDGDFQPYKFSQTWVWLSLLLWVAIVGILHAVLFKGQKRINELLGEIETTPPAGGTPPQVAEITTIGKQLASFSIGLDVLVIVVLYLMIWKPGA